MFTGIIEATAEVIRNQDGKLIVQRPASFDDLKPGSSICISGACLTVTKITEKEMTFDVVSETLRKTTLGSKKEGERVNMERALRASGRFDGHVVQGHVEGVGTVTAVSDQRSRLRQGYGGQAAVSGCYITLSVPSALHSLILPKGSITLDGVSLTVVTVTKKSFSVALIPTTLRDTTLGLLKKGDRVNVETDILGRYVRQFLASRS